MDALAVVRHLHSLAEKPENRSTIVKVKPLKMLLLENFF